MISRPVEQADRPSIEAALARDVFHSSVSSDVFFQPGTCTSVYEDDGKPVLLVRAYRSLHLDLMCFDNADTVRNKAVLEEGWPRLVENAKANGFKEINTSANGPALLKFLTKKIEDGGFGFEVINVKGEVALRRAL
jgi:hypothetical protein